MMKKTIALASALMLTCSAVCMNAFAADETESKVYVTIADGAGKLALAQEEITLTDVDSDGALTVNDALIIAHNAKFEGGAEAGYASSEGQYGLMLNKLWGTENGGSYGYYVNNKASNSLGDTLSDGDYINAFVYKDTTGWSDTYCYFDLNKTEADKDTELTLTLSKSAYDANWNPVTLPEEGASILINGEATSYITDAEGKVTIKLENVGTNVISAVCEKDNLVPPVCIAEVKGEADTDATTTTTTETTTTETETESETTTTTETEEAPEVDSAEEEDASYQEESTIPATGDNGTGAAIAVLGAALAAAFVFRRRNEE